MENKAGTHLRAQLAKLVGTLPDAPVRRLMVGVHMTAVAARTVGCAYTWRDQIGAAHLCGEITGGGRLRGTSTARLAERLTASVCLERSVGMAALNSLLNVPKPRLQTGDILAYLRGRFSGARVGMIGHFPFAPEIREWAGEFKIIEKSPVEDDLPEEAGAAWLKTCDLVIITGVTLLNDTLPGIIKAAPKAWKMMLGPTVPLHEILLDAGLDALNGIVCTDEERYWPGIEEGAIVPRYEGCASHILAKEKLDLPPGDFRARLAQRLTREKTLNASMPREGAAG